MRFKDLSPDEYERKLAEEAFKWGGAAEDYVRKGLYPDLRHPGRKVESQPPKFSEDPKTFRIFHGEYIDFIIKIAALKGGRVLELGCGPGWLSLELARNGLDVEGIDISEKSLEIARSFLKKNIYKNNFGSLVYRLEDLNKIILKESFYDSVVVCAALHHILKIEQLIKEVKKALKPGGNFLVFDHIGAPQRNLITMVITGLTRLALPTKETLFLKIKSLLKRIRDKGFKDFPSQEEPWAPFEYVTGPEMIDIIKENFQIKQIKKVMAFTHYFVPQIKLGDFLKYPLISLLKAFDDFLIKLHLAQGGYIFLWCRKV